MTKRIILGNKVELEVTDNANEIEFYWKGAYYVFPKIDLDESIKRQILTKGEAFAYISDYFVEDDIVTHIEITWEEESEKE